jgi:hypothetical protein
MTLWRANDDDKLPAGAEGAISGKAARHAAGYCPAVPARSPAQRSLRMELQKISH